MIATIAVIAAIAEKKKFSDHMAPSDYILKYNCSKEEILFRNF